MPHKQLVQVDDILLNLVENLKEFFNEKRLKGN